jgi:hypothetical protein
MVEFWATALLLKETPSVKNLVRKNESLPNVSKGKNIVTNTAKLFGQGMWLPAVQAETSLSHMSGDERQNWVTLGERVGAHPSRGAMIWTLKRFADRLAAGEATGRRPHADVGFGELILSMRSCTDAWALDRLLTMTTSYPAFNNSRRCGNRCDKDSHHFLQARWYTSSKRTMSSSPR